jgi:hypothetical protein
MKIGSMSMIVNKPYIVSVILVLLISCTPVKYTDISTDLKFEGVIGQEFMSTQKLLAIEVTFDPNYKKQVDYTFVMKKPGISGPQVINTTTLEAGIKFRINEVYIHRTVLNNRILYAVSIVNKKSTLKNIVIKVFGSINDGNFGLDIDAYSIITKES